ncbi:MAG: primosomal protein N' [Ruminococcaceae bacterium]|nr:primosomal protein N' [Oscillospiraceae bacterium]
MLIAEIILEQTAFSYDKPYSYAIPDSLKECLKPGCRVVVPFGKGNTRRQGMVLEVKDVQTDIMYKEVERLLDDSPILTEEMLELCSFMHERCFCTYFDAVKAVLPIGMSFNVREIFSLGETPFPCQYGFLEEFFRLNETATRAKLLETFDTLSDKKLSSLVKNGCLVKDSLAVRKMGEATLKTVRLKALPEEIQNLKLTPRQKEIIGLLEELGAVSLKEISYFTGASSSVVSTLAKKGIVEIFSKEIYRSPIKDITPKADEITLTGEQNDAYSKLLELYSSDKGEAALLYGVTGSGKTSVFLKMVDRVVAENKGAIIMVPEISLTPQTVAIFGNRYGKKVALFHSAMSLGQRMDEWRRVKNGEACVAIGTRSAVFAPVKNLSLIIIDEEQEHTYKSEKSPRFHARDVAKFRVAYNNALLVMASATPSLESYTAAKLGKYTLCTIPNRFGNAKLPKVKTVDMRQELRQGNSGPLSNDLKLAINDALQKGKQAIVLLNRRGHNTYISCPTCGYVATCPNCSVSMTFHSANNRLMCHYCGYSESAVKKCPVCVDSNLRFMGVGTQKLHEELKATFPDASVLRMDADSTSSKDSYNDYLNDFASGKYNIMLGTQMVAKGLNFPNVTVVGVIGADSAANSSDYRSFERSFSLLTQVFGRAGRGEDEGVAIIQTTDPESNLIRLAAQQDYDSFYSQELAVRKMMTYPPYCDIAQIVVSSSFKELAENTASEVFRVVTEQLKEGYSDIKLRILGPSPAATPKVNNKYRYRLIIKAKNNKRFRELIRKATSVKCEKDTVVSVDINPETII